MNKQSYKQYEEKIDTGIPVLNQMMQGGIPRGSTTLLSGSSGTGKTIVALSFACAGLQQGEDTVFVTFEENVKQLVKVALSLGIDLEKFIEEGKLHVMYFSPVELNVDELIFRIQTLVRDTASQRVIVDSISAFEVGMEDKTKYMDNIWALTDYFKAQGNSVLLTHEITDSDNISMLTKHGISYLADNLLLLRYIEDENNIKRYLRVVKMRGSKHSTELRELLIDSQGIRIGEKP